jgi:hypothetical protein
MWRKKLEASETFDYSIYNSKDSYRQRWNAFEHRLIYLCIMQFIQTMPKFRYLEITSKIQNMQATLYPTTLNARTSMMIYFVKYWTWIRLYHNHTGWVCPFHTLISRKRIQCTVATFRDTFNDLHCATQIRNEKKMVIQMSHHHKSLKQCARAVQ